MLLRIGIGHRGADSQSPGRRTTKRLLALPAYLFNLLNGTLPSRESTWLSPLSVSDYQQVERPMAY